MKMNAIATTEQTSVTGGTRGIGKTVALARALLGGLDLVDNNAN